MANREPVPIKFPPNQEQAKLFAKALAIAKQFPGVEESRSYGTPSIAVKQKFLARLRSEAEGGLAIRCDIANRDMPLMAAPEVFYLTEHYKNSSMILINLKTVRWDAMKNIIEQAWRMVATAKLIKEFEFGMSNSAT